MGEEQIKQLLKDFGLTDTETEVYLFLSKQGVLKGTEIAKRIKKDKAQIYHILRSLQAKGLVESTLESPVRFTPVAFESVVESTIKAKKEEANKIEATKKELLSYWKNLNKQKTELPLEKFSVIEGKQRIYAKIGEMVQNAQKQVSTVAIVPNLLRVEESGIYESLDKNPSKAQINFRFLTSLFDQNTKSFSKLQTIWAKNSRKAEFRTPDLRQKLFPEMVIADDKETIFFIAKDKDNSQKNEVCLWTNSKSLTQAFNLIFENLWATSTNILNANDKIGAKQATGKNTECNLKKAEIQYHVTLREFKEEIIMTTSSWNLNSLLEDIKSMDKKGLSIKIMVPITGENWEIVKQLSNHVMVKHLPARYLDTTIVDRKHLFQFQGTSLSHENTSRYFENSLYSDNSELIDARGCLLDDLWENSMTPSSLRLNEINPPPAPTDQEIFEKGIKKMYLAKIDQNSSSPQFLKDLGTENLTSRKVTTFGANAQAIIHPPKSWNLPDILFQIYHIEKHSILKPEEVIVFHLWLDTPMGSAFVPVALLTTNPSAVDFWKAGMGDKPNQNTVYVMEQNEFEVRLQHNTLFAGWTKPVFLTPSFTLPPACLIVEGYGSFRNSNYTVTIPSGYKISTSFTWIEAFVTFLQPLSKYSGPGTDGLLAKEVIMEFYPP